MSEAKPKTLFDHIKEITSGQDPKYWDKLDEPSRRTFSNFMVHRFLSMNPDWIELIAELQPYTEILEPREMYLAYIGIIPRGKYYLRYVKGKKESKYESWLIDLIMIDYSCSKTQALDYCEILYATKEGREHLKYICEKYGTDTKKITTLKLKI